MLSTKDAAMVYETLLTSPGMNDEVKLSIKMPRKTILLLCRIIETGLISKNGQETDGLLHAVNGDSLESLKAVGNDLLEKAGLTGLYEKLNSLQNK